MTTLLEVQRAARGAGLTSRIARLISICHQFRTTTTPPSITPCHELGVPKDTIYQPTDRRVTGRACHSNFRHNKLPPGYTFRYLSNSIIRDVFHVRGDARCWDRQEPRRNPQVRSPAMRRSRAFNSDTRYIFQKVLDVVSPANYPLASALVTDSWKAARQAGSQ